MSETEADAREAHRAALRALEARDHTRASLAARLAGRGLDEQACAEVVERLARVGYVDDRRFAQGRAAVLAARGAGDALIRDDLLRQGVPEEAAAAALASLEPESDRVARLVAARGRSARTVRLLAGKGFAAESLEALVAEIEEGAVG